MADLSVKYAGLTLKNPLICGSGPRTDTVEGCKAAADAGFGAIILKSRTPGLDPIEHQHAIPRFKTVNRLRPYERWTPEQGVEIMAVAAVG